MIGAAHARSPSVRGFSARARALLKFVSVHIPGRLTNSQRLAIALVSLGVGAFYLWTLRATGYHFDFKKSQDGYYNYLAQGFASGHLYLSWAPDPALLAMPNPWDFSIPDNLKLHDAVLYNGHYYLYHGAGPAVMLFTPWKLITGHDLPQRFAILLMCFGAYAFLSATLLRWLRLAGAKIGPGLLAAALLALGVCQGAPYLLNRVDVYEIAIAGAYFSLSAGMFFLVRSAQSRRAALWLGASGFMFGMAAACRPQLGMGGAFALLGLALFYFRRRGLTGIFRSRELMAFAFAFAAVGVGVMAYNYARFGNVFDFGLRYLLSGPEQNRVKLSAEYLLPGLYFWLLCPPNVSAVFPWLTLIFRFPLGGRPFPVGYFMEATMGAPYLAPFVIGAFLVPLRTRTGEEARETPVGPALLLWTSLATSVGALLFLAFCGFTTQRYEVDFLPLAVLAALANVCIHISRRAGRSRFLMSGALTLLIACGVVANMALALSGPYDGILKSRPAGYVRLARWFSPIERYRPMLNPYVDIDVKASLDAVPDKQGAPLVTMGRQVYRYFLYVKRADGKFRLISRNDERQVEYVMEARDVGSAELRLTYRPETGTMVTQLNGRVVLTHEIGTLVTSPAEVTVGENRIENNVVEPRFPGPIGTVFATIKESPATPRP